MTKLPELKADGSVCSRDGCNTYIDDDEAAGVPRLCPKCKGQPRFSLGSSCAFCGRDLGLATWCAGCGRRREG